jgi:hypothetical protein
MKTTAAMMNKAAAAAANVGATTISNTSKTITYGCTGASLMSVGLPSASAVVRSRMGVSLVARRFVSNCQRSVGVGRGQPLQRRRLSTTAKPELSTEEKAAEVSKALYFVSFFFVHS